MIKKLLMLFIASAFAIALSGCGPKEEDVKVPTAKPGSEPFSPAGVQDAGSGAGGGAPLKPVTE